MDYSVDYLPTCQLPKIRDKWLSFEVGRDMTVFQSYEWYHVLQDYYIPDDTNNYKSVLAVVRCDGIICLIAPLWIILHTFNFLNRRGVYFLGRDSYGDYLNFIYNEFDSDAFDFLINDVQIKYHVKYFVFEQLKEDTVLYQYICKSSRYRIQLDSEEPCVSLNLPNSIDAYNQMLSKNTKQNLRTAKNRLIKDGKNLVFNYDNTIIDRKKCLAIRESKLSVKYAKISGIRKFKYRMVNRLLFHFPSFSPLIDYLGSKVMTVEDDNENLLAFFHYAYDTNNQCVRIMSAGTDLKFARYSPGMLLMYNYIQNVIKGNYIKVIDFTRGGEKYKYSLGGELQNNHKLKFCAR